MKVRTVGRRIPLRFLDRPTTVKDGSGQSARTRSSRAQRFGAWGAAGYPDDTRGIPSGSLHKTGSGNAVRGGESGVEPSHPSMCANGAKRALSSPSIQSNGQPRAGPRMADPCVDDSRRARIVQPSDYRVCTDCDIQCPWSISNVTVTFEPIGPARWAITSSAIRPASRPTRPARDCLSPLRPLPQRQWCRTSGSARCQAASSL